MNEKKKARKKGKDDADAIRSDILVEILQESIRTIWRFIRSDKRASTQNACRKRSRIELEDSLDPKLLVEVQADLQKVISDATIALTCYVVILCRSILTVLSFNHEIKYLPTKKDHEIK